MGSRDRDLAEPEAARRYLEHHARRQARPSPTVMAAVLNVVLHRVEVDARTNPALPRGGQ